MKRSSKILITTTAVVGLTAAALSFAGPGGWGNGQGCRGYGPGAWQQGQMTGPGGMGPGYMQGQPGMGPGNMLGRRGGMGPGFNPGNRTEFHAQRMDALKAQLQITPEQEAAWQAFAETADKNMASMTERFAQRGSQKSIAERAQFMRDRAARMASMADAIDALYKELTTEQQQLADRFAPMGGMMGGRR